MHLFIRDKRVSCVLVTRFHFIEIFLLKAFIFGKYKCRFVFLYAIRLRRIDLYFTIPCPIARHAKKKTYATFSSLLFFAFLYKLKPMRNLCCTITISPRTRETERAIPLCAYIHTLMTEKPYMTFNISNTKLGRCPMSTAHCFILTKPFSGGLVAHSIASYYSIIEASANWPAP